MIKSVKATAEKEILLLRLQQKLRIKKSVQKMVQGVDFIDQTFMRCDKGRRGGLSE